MVKNVSAGSGSGFDCPRCGGPVSVGKNAMFVHFGLIGALLHLLWVDYECPECGKIKFSEFPPEVRSRTRLKNFLIIAGVILAIAAFVAAIIYFTPKA